MKWQFRIVIFACGSILASCESQVFRNAAVCYGVNSMSDLRVGDTLTVFNCCTGDYAWLGLTKDTNDFHRSVEMVAPASDGYWRLKIDAPGTWYVRIRTGFELSRAPDKEVQFSVNVSEMYDP